MAASDRCPYCDPAYLATGSSHTCAGTDPPLWSSRFLSGLFAVGATGGQLGGGCAALGEVQSEEFRKITGAENGRGIGSFLCQPKVPASATDEFVFVQLMKPKKKFGLAVEARANAVEHALRYSEPVIGGAACTN